MTDFLAVGDVTTDTFIKLKEAEVTCDMHGEACTISMHWGDKIPYESATVVAGVGNAANAAVSASRLGLKSGLLTCTGTDKSGDGDVESLAQNGVDIAKVSRIEALPSNKDYVLWYDNERTILVKHSLFPYAIESDSIPPGFVYLSSLGDPSGRAHNELVAWLSRYPETKLFFQPGQEIRMNRELLKGVYATAYMCVCNKEEAEQILGLPSPQDIRALLEGMAALGPRIVLITDGLAGAYSYDGSSYFKVPLYPDPRAPVERTGAGDAFASTVAVALALGKPLDEALLWGPINSMSVVQKVGAQEGLLSRAEIEAWIEKAPPAYRLQEL